MSRRRRFFRALRGAGAYFFNELGLSRGDAAAESAKPPESSEPSEPSDMASFPTKRPEIDEGESGVVSSSAVTIPEALRDAEVSTGDGLFRLQFDDSSEWEISNDRHLVDLESVLGQSGMPWGWGRLALEHNPTLVPTLARGHLTDTGQFWSWRNHHAVDAGLGRAVRTLRTTPWRLEEPVLPDWLKGNVLAEYCRQRQWEYCRRVWASWTKSGCEGGGLRRFISECLWTAPISGFAAFEIVAPVRRVDFRAGGSQHCYFPQLPKWRAPWAVDYWVTQRERLQGVVFNFSQALDYGGGVGPSRCAIPAEKLLIVSSERIGSNFEGRSWLRSVGRLMDLQRLSYEVHGAALEVYGLGELFLMPKNPSKKDRGGMIDYIGNRRALHAPGAILPHGTEISMTTPSQTMPKPDGMIDKIDNNVLMAMHSEDKGIGLGQTGAYSARADASAGAFTALEDVAEDYVSDPLEQLFIRMIVANKLHWGMDGYIFSPKVVYGAAEERDTGAWLDNIGKAKAYGLLGNVGQREIDMVREEVGFPLLGRETQDA